MDIIFVYNLQCAYMAQNKLLNNVGPANEKCRSPYNNNTTGKGQYDNLEAALYLFLYLEKYSWWDPQNTRFNWCCLSCFLSENDSKSYVSD